MLKKIAILFVFCLPMAAFAGDPPAPPPDAPEVKKTVDMFLGKVSFDATMQAPGMDKPAPFKMAFDCKKTALGKAVACAASAKTPMGPWEASFMIAYDPFSKAVHFMGITSEGEVHDHVCHWKDDMLACDPLKGGGPGGAAITEDMSTVWGDGKVTFTTTSTGADGGKFVITGTAKRK